MPVSPGSRNSRPNTTAANSTRVRNIRLRYAAAPSWTACAISCMRSVPSCAASTWRRSTTANAEGGQGDRGDHRDDDDARAAERGHPTSSRCGAQGCPSAPSPRRGDAAEGRSLRVEAPSGARQRGRKSSARFAPELAARHRPNVPHAPVVIMGRSGHRAARDQERSWPRGRTSWERSSATAVPPWSATPTCCAGTGARPRTSSRTRWCARSRAVGAGATPTATP